MKKKLKEEDWQQSLLLQRQNVEEKEERKKRKRIDVEETPIQVQVLHQVMIVVLHLEDLVEEEALVEVHQVIGNK